MHTSLTLKTRRFKGQIYTWNCACRESEWAWEQGYYSVCERLGFTSWSQRGLTTRPAWTALFVDIEISLLFSGSQQNHYMYVAMVGNTGCMCVCVYVVFMLTFPVAIYPVYLKQAYTYTQMWDITELLLDHRREWEELTYDSVCIVLCVTSTIMVASTGVDLGTAQPYT